MSEKPLSVRIQMAIATGVSVEALREWAADAVALQFSLAAATERAERAETREAMAVGRACAAEPGRDRATERERTVHALYEKWYARGLNAEEQRDRAIAERDEARLNLAACREQLAATDNLRRVAEHELAGAWHTTNELRAALAHTATAGDAVAVPVEALREAVEALHEVYSEISLGKWICRACGGKRDNLTTAECDHRADCLVGKALDSLRALLPGEGA